MIPQSDSGQENTLVDKELDILLLWPIQREPRYDEYDNYQEQGLIGVLGMGSSEEPFRSQYLSAVNHQGTHHWFLNNFKEVHWIKWAWNSITCNIAIDSQHGNKRVSVSLRKYIFQLSTFSRVSAAIFSYISELILAGFLNAYKLRAIIQKVIACLHFSPLFMQLFIPFDSNLVEKFLGEPNLYKCWMKSRDRDFDVMFNGKPENQFIKIKVQVNFIECLDSSKHSLCYDPLRSFWHSRWPVDRTISIKDCLPLIETWLRNVKCIHDFGSFPTLIPELQSTLLRIRAYFSKPHSVGGWGSELKGEVTCRQCNNSARQTIPKREMTYVTCITKNHNFPILLWKHCNLTIEWPKYDKNMT